MDKCKSLESSRAQSKGWGKCIRYPKSQVSSRKRATNYTALSRKMTLKDKASHGSSPPCMYVYESYRVQSLTVGDWKWKIIWVKERERACAFWLCEWLRDWGPRMRVGVVCCSVLQCVAVCCSVLQCVAVCCSVLQCVVMCCSVLQCVAVWEIGVHR